MRRKVADAVVRVFIDHGNRTDRTKARLKYVLDKMGVEKFLELVEEKLGRKLDRAVPGALRAAAGVHPHRAYRHPSAEAGGLHWIGVVVPVGQLDRCADARARRRSRASSATAISG